MEFRVSLDIERRRCQGQTSSEFLKCNRKRPVAEIRRFSEPPFFTTNKCDGHHRHTISHARELTCKQCGSAPGSRRPQRRRMSPQVLIPEYFPYKFRRINILQSEEHVYP